LCGIIKSRVPEQAHQNNIFTNAYTTIYLSDYKKVTDDNVATHDKFHIGILVGSTTGSNCGVREQKFQ